jgi:hypothetical protein
LLRSCGQFFAKRPDFRKIPGIMAQLPQELHGGAARRTIKSMDWQFAVGLGTAVVFFLFPYAVKDMPAYVTWPGIAIGLLFIIWGLLPNRNRIPHGIAFLCIACIAGFISAGFYFWPSTKGANEEAIKKPTEVS